MLGWTRGGRKQQSEQIEALEKAVEGLESRLKLLRNEWEDVFDRMNRVMGRLNARIRKSEAVAEPESDTEEVRRGIVPSQGPVGTHAQLMEMRRKHGLLPG